MQTVLLLFGGESTEHEVSIASAINVAQAVDPDRFTIAYGYIDREGLWWSVNSVTKDLPENAKQLIPIMGKGAFIVGSPDTIIEPDVILPIVHGQNGEDGAIQALGQLVHIPVVGCDMTSSAAAMNKFITKQIAMANNIRVVPFTVHYAKDGYPDYKEVSDKLSATLFVKPANAGSAIGVHRVTNQAELEEALKDAHTHDEIALIETAINARELEVSILGNYPDVHISAVSEIKPDREFYTYESKYGEKSTSQVIIPAEISPELAETLRKISAQMFRLLGGSGLARVDFFIDTNTQEVFLNEVNTIPGFTNISVYPKAWDHAGITYGVLIEKLIQLALEPKPYLSSAS
jgi:D-alanine-D-alanine ligase